MKQYQFVLDSCCENNLVYHTTVCMNQRCRIITWLCDNYLAGIHDSIRQNTIGGFRNAQCPTLNDHYVMSLPVYLLSISSTNFSDIAMVQTKGKF